MAIKNKQAQNTKSSFYDKYLLIFLSLATIGYAIYTLLSAPGSLPAIVFWMIMIFFALGVLLQKRVFVLLLAIGYMVVSAFAGYVLVAHLLLWNVDGNEDVSVALVPILIGVLPLSASGVLYSQYKHWEGSNANWKKIAPTQQLLIGVFWLLAGLLSAGALGVTIVAQSANLVEEGITLVISLVAAILAIAGVTGKKPRVLFIASALFILTAAISVVRLIISSGSARLGALAMVTYGGLGIALFFGARSHFKEARK